MGIGPQELIVIFFIILLLFGAKKIPQIARSLGEAIKEVRNIGKEAEETSKKLEG
jgi:sec-independent protein translocase protein TatA